MGRNSGGVIGGKTGSGGKLSELATEAIDYYVDGNGYDLTYALRHGETPQGEDALLMKGLDEATKRPLSKSMTLYRGVSIESLYGSVGVENYGLIKSHLVNNDHDPFVVSGYKKAMNQKKVKYVDAGYMSASKDSSVASGFGGDKSVVMKLKVPKGARGIDLTANKSAYKTNTNEHEVLLARNTTFKLGKLYSKNGILYVDATVVRKH